MQFFAVEEPAPVNARQHLNRLQQLVPRWLWHPGLWLTVFVYFVHQEFRRNQCLRSAAALTYATIFALFPLLALLSIVVPAFFGGAEELQNRVLGFIQDVMIPPTKTYFVEGPSFFIARPTEPAPGTDSSAMMGPPAPDSTGLSPKATEESSPRAKAAPDEPIRTEILTEINKYFENFRRNYIAIGFLGAIGFLIVCTILYINVERTLNDIWKIHRQPGFVPMFSRFIIILTCAPLLLGASFAVSVLIARLGFLGNLLLSFLPYLLITTFLTLAYYILPRLEVRLTAALMGGVIAGLFWEGAKIAFGFYLVSPQIRVLYKSVGAIPIMLLWFYYSWAIFLLGGTISYVAQNFRRLRRARTADTMPHLDYRWVLAVAVLVAQEFQKGAGGISPARLEELLPLAREDLDRIIAYLIDSEGFGINTKGRLILERPPTLIPLNSFLKPLLDVQWPEPSEGEDDGLAESAMGLDRPDWLRSHQMLLNQWINGKTLQDFL
ncbi:MAG: hypothetical protein Kow0059_09500 [Candidatus Sumerlaeia bacterium]